MMIFVARALSRYHRKCFIFPAKRLANLKVPSSLFVTKSATVSRYDFMHFIKNGIYVVYETNNDTTIKLREI